MNRRVTYAKPGSALRSARLYAGLTAAEMAELVCLHTGRDCEAGTVEQWEEGLLPVPDDVRGAYAAAELEAM